MRSHRFPVLVHAWLAVLLTAWVAACGAAGPGTPAEPFTLTVATYNIRHGRGTDDVLDLERTAAVLRRLDADIIALQEVDEAVERSGGVDQAEWLGARLGTAHAFGAFFDYQGGRYGMGLLTRLPMRRVEEVRLPDGNEPRVALAVEMERPGGGSLTAVVVHFDWVAADSFRYAQAEVVAEYLDELDGPWLVLGDFNDQPGSRTLDLFGARARNATKPAGASNTFPSTDPEREIDFIFVGPPAEWTARNVQVVEERVASDHRPVVTTLTWRPGGMAP